MLEIINKDKCCGCFSCCNSCPKQCISMVPDNEGFLYPKIDASKCINCNLCEKVCPIVNPPAIDCRERTAFAAINRNENVRLKSSSGGIFSLIAEDVINKGGLVFGAALSNDCKSVHHVAIENTSDLDWLRGSKYVQSSIGNTYNLTKKALEEGKNVLFSGTPCQISGLHKYLGKEYINLYTCDFICHGVPSPLVWKKYVEYREEIAGSKAQTIFFRNKKDGWKSFSIHFIFMNCTDYLQKLSKDLYMRGFLSDIYLRPSCYNCSFKGVKRQADITLADFWGVENISPKMNDNKGTSLIIIHSEKAHKLFESLAHLMICQSVDINKAVKYNTAAEKSVSIPKIRDIFFKDFETIPFPKLLNKYCSINPKERIRKIIGKILRKLKKFRRV